MVEREQYEKELKDLGSDEEDTLDVFDDVPEQEQQDKPATASVNTKGKQKAGSSDITMEDNTQPGKKRRRPAIDPFGGASSKHIVSKIPLTRHILRIRRRYHYRGKPSPTDT